MYSSKENVNILTVLMVAHGINKVVVCPGSRNSPLVHNFDECPDIQCFPVTDERSAGFYALGMAETLASPVAVCVTSGSALLNTIPAVAEASFRNIGILIISADRPSEWIGQMDGQTMIQTGVFSHFVKKEVSLPESHNTSTRWHCNRLVNEAILSLPDGPVHINVPISEPLFDYNIKELPKERVIHHVEWSSDLLSRFHRPMVVLGQLPPIELPQNIHNKVAILSEPISSAFVSYTDAMLMYLNNHNGHNGSNDSDNSNGFKVPNVLGDSKNPSEHTRGFDATSEFYKLDALEGSNKPVGIEESKDKSKYSMGLDDTGEYNNLNHYDCSNHLDGSGDSKKPSAYPRGLDYAYKSNKLDTFDGSNIFDSIEDSKGFGGHNGLNGPNDSEDFGGLEGSNDSANHVGLDVSNNPEGLGDFEVSSEYPGGLDGTDKPNKLDALEGSNNTDGIEDSKGLSEYLRGVNGADEPNKLDALEGSNTPDGIEDSKGLSEYLRGIDGADGLNNPDELGELGEPDVVLYLGGNTISKRLRQYIRSIGAFQIVCSKEFHDISNHTNLFVTEEPSKVLQDLSLLPDNQYAANWQKFRSKVDAKHIAFTPEYSGLLAVKLLEQSLPPSSHVFYANSLAIRYAEIYASGYRHCNRGLNGIEGSASAAAGASLVTSNMVFLITGDLSFLYDGNSLWQNNLRGNLRIMVINNGGGGIFDTLPGNSPYISGQHTASIEGITRYFGAKYLKVTDEKSLVEFLPTFQSDSSVPVVMEVVTNPKQDAAEIEKYYNSIK